jgi:hypothetical protein
MALLIVRCSATSRIGTPNIPERRHEYPRRMVLNGMRDLSDGGDLSTITIYEQWN